MCTYPRLVCLALFLGLLAAGCGKSLPPQADAKQSRSALITALDAWKDGKTLQAFRDASPDVDFRDNLWESAASLKKYEVEKEEPSGQSIRVTVCLFLKSGTGQRMQRVVYIADAGPKLVIRPEF